MKAIILILTVVLIFVGIVTAKHYLSRGVLDSQAIPIHRI